MLVSPALQRGEYGYHKFVTESRRFSVASQGFSHGRDWIFKASGSIPPMILGRAISFPARPSVHRQDEPAGLSLGMVASQQCLLPFHPAIDSTAN